MLLIVPLPVHIGMILLGAVSFFLLFFIFYRYVVLPASRKKNDIESPPPKEGFVYDILMDDSNRIKNVGVGQLDSLIKTRLTGIKEDHILLKFRKEQLMEEYSITIKPGGYLFFRPPHSKKMEQIKSPVTIESRELIGNPALLRAAVVVKSGRALQYIEFELSTKYIVGPSGKERMKFSLTLKHIFPSLNIHSRNKKGIYSFGRVQSEQDEMT